MDLTKVDNIKFGDIDWDDYPDFCDAFIESADYDGKEMTDEQLDELNENRDFVYEKLMEELF
jgi:hypothetical protein